MAKIVESKRVRALCVKQAGRCFYCQLTMDFSLAQPHPRAPTRDHLTPRSRGGKNTRDNVVLACYLCNHQKGDMTLDEFRAFRRAVMVLGMSKREALRLARFPNSAQDSKPDGYKAE